MKSVFFLMILFSSLLNASALNCGLEEIPQKLLRGGCGCSYSHGSKTYFESDFDYIRPTVYLHGKLVEGKLISEPHKLNLFMNTKFSETYLFGNDKIDFKNIVSFVCGESSENAGSCEVVRFESEVRVNGQLCEINPDKIIGECGC